MARSLRIEKANGVYHVINRGNYRQDLFINEGSHLAFESCLFEACEKCGWVLEGYCVMTNHFHLVIRTPEGNLVYGMKWLQSTFANRYHHYRKVHGKLFQGRYKSLIVEEESYLGALLHYVHLNPVRAGMMDVAGLRGYRWSSYWYLQHPAKRPAFMDLSGCLEAAGGLSDTTTGRKKYREYLAWLAADAGAQKELLFDRMCRGWAIGSKDFKKGLLSEEADRLKAAFDRAAGAACPSQLSAPALRATPADADVRAASLGGNGVGSQGDGSVQFVCDGEAGAEACAETLRRKFGLRAVRIVIPATKSDA